MKGLSIVLMISFGHLVRNGYCGTMQPLTPTPDECESQNDISEQDLTDSFLSRFGNWQRPRRNARESVVVNITFVLSAIDDVIEKERLIKLSGYISVRWYDDFRVWQDKFPYNCISYIVLPAGDVWLPDIAQMNSRGRYELMTMPGEKVRIYKNGYAIYSPGGIFSAFCIFDLSLFPFDTQKCSIQLESWRYTSKYMSFQFGGNVTIKYWTENEQWSLLGTSQDRRKNSYLDSHNEFDHIEFHIFIKRKVMYYMMNVIIPSSLIALAHLSVFSLPADGVDKIAISFTCLLAYAVFQMSVSQEMPRSSDHVLLLSIYINLQMAYIALSMLGEGVCLIMLRLKETIPKKNNMEMSDVSKKGCPHCTWQTLCCLPNKQEPKHPSTVTGIRMSDETVALAEPHLLKERPPSRRKSLITWRVKAKMASRINFVTYLLCIIITPIVMFVVYPKLASNHVHI